MSKRSQVGAVCHGHSRPIVELSYSAITPDGYFLTSASKDGQPMLREGRSGDWIGTFQGHKGAVWSCVLNEEAVVAATASADFSTRLWNALTGDEVLQFQHSHIARTVAFARRSPRLLSAGYEKILRLYDVERPDAAPAEIRGAPDKVRTAAWHQNDQLLLTAYIDQPGISVWDMRAERIVRTLETGKAVTSLEVQRDGSFLTSADGSEVRFWDGASLAPGKAFRQEWTVESASFCPAKGRFAAGGEDMWVHLYDYATGEELECNKGHHGPVHTVRFAPDGETYASGSEDGTIRLWRTDWDAAENGAANGAANGA